MTLASWIDMMSVSDVRGQLVAAEADRHIPFDIKRIYYLRDLRGDEPRGFHAHKEIDQAAVCVTGACKILLDDGQHRETVVCEDPTRALRIPPMIWHEMHDFSADCVLLVFASAAYDEADYIRNYDDFVTAMSRNSNGRML
jgi:hypothetical protein